MTFPSRVTCRMIAPSLRHASAVSTSLAPTSSSRRGPPTRISAPSTVAVTPTAGEEENPVAFGRVRFLSFAARTMALASGCSLSASAAAATSSASSSVMSDLVIGKRVDDGLELHEEFLTMMQSQGAYEPDEEQLEDAIAFAGVAKFPVRVKCALLGWSAFKDAAAQALATKES